jgi:hypothetical protein
MSVIEFPVADKPITEGEIDNSTRRLFAIWGVKYAISNAWALLLEASLWNAPPAKIAPANWSSSPLPFGSWRKWRKSSGLTMKNGGTVN